MLDKINHMMGELRHCAPLDDHTGKQLRQDFILNYIYNSLALDGSDLSLEEINSILFQEESLKYRSLKDHLDVFQELDAFLKVEYLLSQGENINNFSMRELHIKLEKYSTGDFRQRNMDMPNIPNQFPPPQEIPHLVSDALSEYNFTISGTHLIHRLAYFHLNFEMIHPFPSKNGNLGRLLVNLGLMRAGYPPIIFYKEDKGRYYEAFNSYYLSKGNGDIMCNLFEKYVVNALEHYSNYQKRDPFVIIGR